MQDLWIKHYTNTAVMEDNYNFIVIPNYILPASSVLDILFGFPGNCSLPSNLAVPKLIYKIQILIIYNIFLSYKNYILYIYKIISC